MTNLGFSANSVTKVMKDPNWVQIYSDEFTERLEQLKSHSILREYFVKVTKPLLDGLVGDKKDVDIRGAIQKWMLIYTHKSWALIRVLNLESHDNNKKQEILEKYAGIPVGPLDADIVNDMTGEELKSWREGSAAISYAYYNYKNILGLFCSELFFAVEAACRVICIGACLDFAIKSLLSNIIIQHDEVFKTIKRIGQENTEKVSCITCASKGNCLEIPSLREIASLYEICYHLRVIKDYKLEFYWEHKFEEFLKAKLIPKGMDIIYHLEKTIDSLFENYMTSPFSLSDDRENMDKLIFC